MQTATENSFAALAAGVTQATVKLLADRKPEALADAQRVNDTIKAELRLFLFEAASTRRSASGLLLGTVSQQTVLTSIVLSIGNKLLADEAA